MLRVTSRSWCFLLAKALQPQTFAALLGLRTSQAKQNGRGNLRGLCAPETKIPRKIRYLKTDQNAGLLSF